MEENDLRNARFWQGFQTRSNSSLSTGAGKVRKWTAPRIVMRLLDSNHRISFIQS
jgi:hypothetical protein